MHDSQIPHDRRLFGKYSLIAKLAAGGMGEIYLARLEGVAGFEKIVVIKRVLPHLVGSEKYTVMLLDEARIAARLSHPNICQVYELGEVDGEYYIAMEYLEGVAMSELFRRLAKFKRRMDPRLVVAIVAQACEGLHAAHELEDRDGRPTGLVHRDISPSNIFVSAAGAVKILDFGIAKTPDKQDTTRTGMIKGKWAYMSPEQTLGEPLDRRSDIFSLGIVLFEALTMRRLYARASEYLTCRAITEFDAPSVRQYRPDIADELARVVARALTRDRDERFASARDMSKALTMAAASIGGPASLSELAEFIDEHFSDELDARRAFLQRLDSGADVTARPESIRAELPIVPHGPMDTSISSGPELEYVRDEEATRSLQAVAREPEELPPVSAGTDQLSLSPHAVARASQRALPLVSPPTETVQRYMPEFGGRAASTPAPAGGDDSLARSLETFAARDDDSLPEVMASGRMTARAPSTPAPTASGTPSAAALAGSRRAPTPHEHAPADTTFRTRREPRSGISPWLVLLIALLVAGGSAVGVYFGLRAPRAEKPAVVVYPGAGDEVGDGGVGSADAGQDEQPAADAGQAQRQDTRKRDGKRTDSRRPSGGDPVSRAVSRSRAKLSACLEEHAAGVEGSPNVRVKVAIETSGKVSSASIEPSALGATELGACVLRVIRGIDFGRRDAAVEATIPLKLKRTR